MDYPCGPRLIFVDEFNQRSKHIFGTLNGRKCGQFLFSVRGRGSSYFTLAYLFFNSIPIGWVRFSLVKESTYFRGAEVWRKYYPMQFVSCSCCVKIEPKTAVYETKDEILFLLPGLTKPMIGIQEKFEQVYNMRNL